MRLENLLAASIGAVIAFTVVFSILIVLGIGIMDIDYSSRLTAPAALYEIGEIINDDYQIVATDSQNTLWVQKRNEDLIYLAVASSDYSNLSFSERIKWLCHNSLKDSISIEITEQVEKQDVSHERS